MLLVLEGATALPPVQVGGSWGWCEGQVCPTASLGPLLLLCWSCRGWQPPGRAVAQGKERAARALRCCWPTGTPVCLVLAPGAAVPSLQDGVPLGAGAGCCAAPGEGSQPGWESVWGGCGGPCQAPPAPLAAFGSSRHCEPLMA